MDDLTASAEPRLRPLLDHFSKIEDTRQLRRVVYQLREIPFLVVCGTIASGDDYDDIVDSGAANWGFLRGISDVLCERLPRGRKCGELPHRPRRQKHGRAPPLRPQSGAPSRRQTIHQATPQAAARILYICCRYSGRRDVNLDSFPWHTRPSTSR
jgi:hypothetical protein